MKNTDKLNASLIKSAYQNPYIQDLREIEQDLAKKYLKMLGVLSLGSAGLGGLGTYFKNKKNEELREKLRDQGINPDMIIPQDDTVLEGALAGGLAGAGGGLMGAGAGYLLGDLMRPGMYEKSRKPLLQS